MAYSFNLLKRSSTCCIARSFSSSYTNIGSVYVHWPYCLKKCVHCNFNKYIVDDIDHKNMEQCLIKEMRHMLDMSHITMISSIFFGGGTPSIALPSTIALIVDSVQKYLSADAEITLEANPTRLTRHQLIEFRAAGINRLSVGVQTLDDVRLQWMGRDHSADDAVQCLREAASLFPHRVSADVMFGLPGQTLADLRRDVERVAALCDGHLSLYQLTVKRGTPLYKQVHSGCVQLPDDDLMADMYLNSVEWLRKIGLHRYEVSNFSAPGCECRHNVRVWRGGLYAGVGPGAHGRLVLRAGVVDTAGSALSESSLAQLQKPRRTALVQLPEPSRWAASVARCGHGTAVRSAQTRRQALAELLCTSLRTGAGLRRRDWRLMCDDAECWPFSMVEEDERRRLEDVCSFSDHAVTATDRGLMLLDSWLPDVLNVMYSHLDRMDSSTQSAVT